MEVTTRPDVPVPALRFVPAGFDPTDTVALDACARALLDRVPADPTALERWVEDWSELAAQVEAGLARRRIAMTRDTADATLRERYLAFERGVVPVWKRLEDRLRRHYLAHADGARPGARLAMFDRRQVARTDIFSEASLALREREAGLRAEHAQLTGTSTVRFRGRTLTLPQCRRHLEDEDRATRAEAFHALAGSAARLRDGSDDLFDRLLDLRQRMAANAGFPDYRSYRFRELFRFDYGADDCLAFHEAVERVVVPALRERTQVRRARLGLDAVRPYDLAVDLTGAGGTTSLDTEQGLLDAAQAVFGAVDPAFADAFALLRRNALLDVMSRPGKAPGGYNAGIADIRLPFIFMNAAGGRGDLRTLLHEGGHAFHSLATRDEPVLDLRSAPTEFAEVASMAMEHFGLERLGAAVEEREARALAVSMLEGRLRLLTWVATIDAFQHWIYTHPGHARDTRTQVWTDLRARFSPEIDWSGLEGVRAIDWQGQLHLFQFPFYYIEYALALVGALQLWRRFRAEPEDAVAGYRHALALGGTRPLPDLFAAAGARFATDEDTLRSVVADLMGRLESIGA